MRSLLSAEMFLAGGIIITNISCAIAVTRLNSTLQRVFRAGILTGRVSDEPLSKFYQGCNIKKKDLTPGANHTFINCTIDGEP